MLRPEVESFPVAKDPITLFNRLYAQARHAHVPLHEACALATATRSGRVSVRFVLLKGADERGFVFYTNTESRKGMDLKANPQAALAFYWDKTGKQVRVEGPVRTVSGAEADAYWATRPWQARLGGIASRQSQPMSTRAALLWRVLLLRIKHPGNDIPRPRHWTGYRIIPERIEFWYRGVYRLHRRELFVRSGRRWRRSLLQP